MIALVDTDVQRLEKAGTTFSSAAKLTRRRDPACHQPDIATVAVSNDMHAAVAAELLQAGINILVE